MKTYNKKTFEFNANGKTYVFGAYSTDTRSGFCHHIIDEFGRHTRVSYSNRTWESYDYESALRSAFNKYPKSEREWLAEASKAYSKQYADEVERSFAPVLAMAKVIGSMRNK